MTDATQTQAKRLTTLALASAAGLVLFCLLPMATFRLDVTTTLTALGIYRWLIAVPLVPVLLVLAAPRLDMLHPHRALLAMVAGAAALVSLVRLFQTSIGFGSTFREFAAMGADLPDDLYTVHWLFILVGAAALLCGIAIGIIGIQLRNTP